MKAAFDGGGCPATSDSPVPRQPWPGNRQMERSRGCTSFSGGRSPPGGVCRTHHGGFPDAALGIRGGGGHGRWDWISDLVAQRCPRMEARRNKREVGGGEEENVG